MDLKAIADGIAAQFVNVTATYGGQTQTLTATADLPDTLVAEALLVYPPTGALDLNIGYQRDDEYTFRVLYLQDPISVPARVGWLYAWQQALRDKVEANMDLGLSYVVWARATESRMELDGESYSYNGVYKPLDVVEITHVVKVRETVATLAI